MAQSPNRSPVLKTTRVVPVRTDALCECGSEFGPGHMAGSGTHQHFCKGCKREEWFERWYPYIVYEPVQS